jgi:methionyl-tRNA formyltransferase
MLMVKKKVAFYIMTSKGLFVIKKFVENFGPDAIGYIVAARDSAIKHDAFEEIYLFAQDFRIQFFERSNFDLSVEQGFDGVKFAIGWRWLIHSQKNLLIFHDSLLPKYRGFAPLVNSLINNEVRGGVTALFADGKYDSGDIVAQKSVEFTYPLKIYDAIKLVEPLYFSLVADLYKLILDGRPLIGNMQSDQEATYSLWLDELDYFVDWAWPAEKIVRFVDAVGYPYTGARVYLGGKEVIIKDCFVTKDVYVQHRSRHLGKVIFIEEGNPVVICSDGLLVIKELTTLSGENLSINFRSRFY